MSMGVKPPEKMADRVQPCVDECNGFLGGWEAGFSRSAGTKKPVVFLAPQHCQPPPGSRSSQSNTTDASVSPLWADRPDCGSVSRNVVTVAAIVGLTPPPVSPNPGRKTR